MKNEENIKNGRFAKGTSGNPAGRPQGSQNKTRSLMDALLKGEAEGLTRKVVELALAGSIPALRICFERLMPTGSDRLVVFDLPAVHTLDDISAGMNGVQTAVCEGELTPHEGETISRTLAQHAEVMVFQDLQKRVEKLEHPNSANDNKVQIITMHK